MNNAIAILSAISFYFIPTILGWLVINILAKKKPATDITTSIIRLFEYFIYGGLVIYTLAIILSKLIGSSEFVNFFNYSLIALTLISLFKLLPKIHLKSKMRLSPILIVTLLSLFTYYLWRFNSPPNTTLDWDIYAHQTIVNQLLKGDFSVSPLKISDTFQFFSYTSFFHTLVAATQAIFKPNIISFWYFIEFFHLLSTILVSYLAAFVISKRKWVGILGAIIGGLTFESFVAYTSLFLMPQNFVATIAIVAMARIITRHRKGENLIDHTTVFSAIFLILGHFIVGLTSALILIFTTTFLTISKKTS